MVHKCDGCRYKGEHREMMFRPMGVCYRGSNLVEAVQNYEAKKCPYKKSNADKIRSMSDEELAKVPAKFGYSCVFPQKECSESDTCEKCLLEWLKQPAEDNP